MKNQLRALSALKFCAVRMVRGSTATRYKLRQLVQESIFVVAFFSTDVIGRRRFVAKALFSLILFLTGTSVATAQFGLTWEVSIKDNLWGFYRGPHGPVALNLGIDAPNGTPFGAKNFILNGLVGGGNLAPNQGAFGIGNNNQLTFDFILPSAWPAGISTCPSGLLITSSGIFLPPIQITRQTGPGELPGSVKTDYWATGPIVLGPSPGVLDDCLNLISNEVVSLEAHAVSSSTDLIGRDFNGQSVVYRNGIQVQGPNSTYTLRPGDGVATGKGAPCPVNNSVINTMGTFELQGFAASSFGTEVCPDSIWVVGGYSNTAPYGGTLWRGAAEVSLRGGSGIDCGSPTDCVEIQNPAGYVVIRKSTITNCVPDQLCFDIVVTTDDIKDCLAGMPPPCSAPAGAQPRVGMTITVNAGTADIVDNNGVRQTLPAGTSVTVYGPGETGTRDFNGDKKSDIVWHDGGGDVAIWLMNGTSATSAVDIANVPIAWQLAGTASLVQSTGDFDGDGRADLLWRHSGGDVSIWEMNGTAPKSAIDIGNVPTAWQIVGAGDFDGDGKADILWRHAGGDVAIWLMNGTTPKSSLDVGNVPTAWQIAGVADFDGDGKADLLWRHTGGDVAIWLMNGTTPKSSLDIGNVPTAWQIVGAGDFDGDGKADILWRHTGGDVAIWEMNGTAVKLSADIGNVPTAWQITSTGDFDGDGKGDILWRHTGGDVAIWEMNGTTPKSSVDIGNVPTAWSIIE